jgi:hypothetical protein
MKTANMPAPLLFRINYGRTDSAACIRDAQENREKLHDLLDEFLDAHKDGKVHETGKFANEFKIIPCETHDFRPFSVFHVGPIGRDEAVVTVPRGTSNLPENETTPSGMPVGAKVVSGEARRRIESESDVEEGDVIIAHLRQEDSGVDDPSAKNILRWWAESTF